MGVSSGTMNRYNLVFPALLALAAGQSQYQSSGGFGGSSSGGFGGFGGGSGGYEGASDAAGGEGSLESNIPGIPGEDYPIFAEVPETAFLCDGQVDGGYYADPEAECQVFHICTADGAGGLAKYSFLCPNGTVFNQNYFICDWWFNFDCAEAEGLYSLNDEYAAERSALDGAASDAQSSYAAPDAAADTGYAAPAEYSGAEGAALRTGRQRSSPRGGRRG